jgi:hypothetical protein
MHRPPTTLAQLQSGALSGARRLKLSEGLAEFPRAIFDLADTLEELDLSGNALSALPDDLHRLRRLRVLFASGNPFTELPEALGACPALELVGFKACRIERVGAGALPPALRWLILTDNRIQTLPDTLGRCPRLQKLMLAGNQLRHLPDTLHACARLELVRIAANGFEELPPVLLDLPRLAWLAYAGNPFSDALEVQAVAAHPGADIDWSALDVGDRLGEGASGMIHGAQWRRDPEAPLAVAVKLFKGAVTSDGLPRSEMAACIAAGTHANLIGIEGRIVGHPRATQGLVMQRIDLRWRNLAGPPSLGSCTRDVYAPELRFTPSAALRLAQGITDAVRHLHQRGILHGDLYAHNIVCDDGGNARLGDFGAASFLPAGDEVACRALRRIEHRALGCLIEELVERLSPAVDPAERRAARDLRAMAQAVLGEARAG